MKDIQLDITMMEKSDVDTLSYPWKTSTNYQPCE
jgi:hypothetical protein